MKPHNDVDKLFRTMFPALYPTATPKLYDADGEVHVGDIVRFNNKPCYVEKIRRDNLVTIVTMDERKYTLNVLPHQINCVLGGNDGTT